MTRFQERAEAIRLREGGATYSEIIKRLKIPKGTLSGWLSTLPLKPTQLIKLKARIKRNRELAIEKTTLIKFKKRQKRLKNTYAIERKRLLPLSSREFFLCGLFLYWGEGTKNIRGAISLNNTDPKVMKFYYRWLTEVLTIPKEKIKVLLHLYKDMNVNHAINYWGKLLNIPKKQFIKPYIKESYRQNIKQKGFGHGTCCLYINNRLLKEKIILGIKAIADYYY